MMVLPFFPANQISSLLENLIEKDLPEELKDIFQPFFDYYKKEWLQIIKPACFSVFKRAHRTNNFSESSNKILNNGISKGPMPSTFLGRFLTFLYTI